LAAKAGAGIKARVNRVKTRKKLNKLFLNIEVSPSLIKIFTVGKEGERRKPSLPLLGWFLKFYFSFPT
jgi:hypothetical protein